MNPGLSSIEALIEKGIEDPSSLIDPKTIFDHFKNQKGVVCIEEFNNILIQLGINFPHQWSCGCSPSLMQTSKALSYQEFVKAFQAIIKQIIHKFVFELGFSTKEIILSLAFIVFVLILQFVFIFIGKSAFSPNTTFSSVINSIMAAAASFTSKGKDGDKEKTSEELLNKFRTTSSRNDRATSNSYISVGY